MFAVRNGGPNGYLTMRSDTLDEALKGLRHEWAYSIAEFKDGVWVDIPEYTTGYIC